MRRKPDPLTAAAGQDSFLDIVANVVGILIILVMVVGARTKDVWVEAANEPAPLPSADELAASQQAVIAIEQDIQKLNFQAKNVELATLAKSVERDQLQQLVTAADFRLNQWRDTLSDADREQFDLRRELEAARRQYDSVIDQQQAIANLASTPEVIHHQPTPLAKTVFGKEEHFQLLGGRLTYVPMNELVDRLKGEWQQKVWKLRDAPEITEIIGPVRGFTMKYTLAKHDVTMHANGGEVHRQVIEFTGFILLPVSSELGEPLEMALQPGSEFRNMLATMEPQRTTITVWTYPDSFEAYRRLKDELRQLGYLTAGRPLPAGHPIGGSPSGSKSAAE